MHVVFKMKAPFAPLQIQEALASRGVRGNFCFNLPGHIANLSYCLTASAKKLGADLEMEPWSWPSISAQSLIDLCEASAKKANSEAVHGHRGRKRKMMTFSEVTDAFLEKHVQTEKDAWTLAKARKAGGDDAVFNTLGGEKSVRELFAKVLRAWHVESIPTGL